MTLDKRRIALRLLIKLLVFIRREFQHTSSYSDSDILIHLNAAKEEFFKQYPHLLKEKEFQNELPKTT